MVPLSVLDLAPITEGSDAAQSFRNSLDLARHAERLGYKRFWLAEHHGMPGIASAATSVVMAHVAGGTKTIRVGAGGIMLPNHSPLVIAEQFGTLESLFPGRIDLALGRAPGSDQLTARALRRTQNAEDPDAFPRDVVELMGYFQGNHRSHVRAVPGAGLRVPVWILGSSLYGAALAAAMGLPYGFASHFAPAQMMEAIAIYREQFQPSEHLERPYVMLGCNVFAADTDAEGRRLFTSLMQAFLRLRRGRPGQLPPPVDPETFHANLSTDERTLIDHALACSAVGSLATVRVWIEGFLRHTNADELIVASQIFDHAARVRSFELTAGLLEA